MREQIEDRLEDLKVLSLSSESYMFLVGCLTIKKVICHGRGKYLESVGSIFRTSQATKTRGIEWGVYRAIVRRADGGGGEKLKIN